MTNQLHNLRTAIERLDAFAAAMDEIVLDVTDAYRAERVITELRRQLLRDLHDAERDVADVRAPLLSWREGTKAIAEYRK